MNRSTARVLFVILVSVLIGTGAVTAGPEPSEPAVKAAFIYNFAKFVDWPVDSTSGKNADSAIIFGVYGKSAITSELEKTTQGKTVHGRAVVITTPKSASEASKCQVLLFGAIPQSQVVSVLDSLKQNPVLTVSESGSFIDGGGIIQFFMSDGRVRFEVSAQAASRAGLVVSSRLLRLSTPSDKKAGRQ
jgi:hypothetical protein